MITPRPALAALIAASALLLVGCSPEAAVPSAPPSAEAEPLFASDEEALAAAEAAYEEYLAVSNKILENGGVGGQELEPIVSEELYAAESQDFADRQENGWRSVGGTELISADLQQWSASPESTEVIAFVCLGYSNVDVVDADGASVVSPDRSPFARYEAVVVFETRNEWRVEESNFWEDLDTCE